MCQNGPAPLRWQSNTSRNGEKNNKNQQRFFKRVFGRKEASPYEFDLAINFDFIKGPAAAAEIVAKAYKEKFRNERTSKNFVGLRRV